MSKTMQAILEKDEEDVQQMARDMEMFIVEHKAGQHEDGIVPFCELCEERREAQAKRKEEARKFINSPELSCEYGHECTSSCGRDRDCPCRSDHLCSASDESLSEAEATLDGHDCKLKQKGYCTECEILENYRRREPKPKCADCNDTGSIEIMGGSDADEWCVIDVKTCRCKSE